MFKEVLPALDQGDKDFYNRLDDDKKKEFVAWITMRWLSSCKGRTADHYLIMVNEFVNHNFSALTKHPELQWKLMALCGTGTKQFHQWIKPGKTRGKNKVQETLSKIYPSLKNDELELLETISSKEEIVDTLIAAGYDDKEIKEIVK
jgi:hypothetical protein